MGHRLVQDTRLGWWLSHEHLVLGWNWLRRHVHDARIGGVMTIHHMVLSIHVSRAFSVCSLVEHVVSLVGTLIVAAIVHIPILLKTTLLIVEVAATILLETWPVSKMIVVVDAATSLLARSLIELEGRLEQKSQKIDKILGAVQTCNLRLVLLISLSILSPLVVKLLISDLPHLLWVAVLDVESILGLEEDISGKLLRSLTLVLLFEIDEGLLSVWNDLNLGHLSLACRGKVNFQFLVGGAWREVFDKETEEHDGLFVLEIVHLELTRSLRLLLGLSNIQVCQLDTLDLLDFRGVVCLTDGASVVSEHVLGSFFGATSFSETDKSEALGNSLTVSHDSSVSDFTEFDKQFF